MILSNVARYMHMHIKMQVLYNIKAYAVHCDCDTIITTTIT